MFTPEIEKQLKTLPDTAQEAIRNFDLTNAIIDLAQKYNLHIDDADVLKNETLAVITGLTPAKEYKNILKQNINLSSDLIDGLLEDTNHMIFTKIRTLMFSIKKDKDAQEIYDALKKEGVVMDDLDTKPSSKLQKLTDTLLAKNRDTRPNYQREPTKKEPLPDTNTKNPYQEPIELSDLAGVSQHRTPYTHHEAKPISENNLSKSLYHKSLMPNVSRFDASPPVNEQIKENSALLDHIEKQKSE